LVNPYLGRANISPGPNQLANSISRSEEGKSC